jgi:hypothetical protein
MPGGFCRIRELKRPTKRFFFKKSLRGYVDTILRFEVEVSVLCTCTCSERDDFA